MVVKRLLRDEEVIIIPNYGPSNIYRTLKSTRYGVYVPYLSLLVDQWIVDATIRYIIARGFGGLTLDEYLGKLSEK